mgnify:CR=1 FL=1
MSRKIVQEQKMSHSLRTYKQGNHFVGVITDLSTGKVVATERTTSGQRNGEGNTLTHLSKKLRRTGLIPVSLKIVKNSTVSYSMERRV